MLERDLRLAELTGGRYHPGQISCRASLDIIRAAKARGLPVTCGISINHLTLNENDIGLPEVLQDAPPAPLRRRPCRHGRGHRQRRYRRDRIGPPSPGRRRQAPPLRRTADGAIGVETLLSAALRLYHDGSVDLSTLLRALTANLARLLGLPSGRLAKGAPADLVLIDLDTPFVVNSELAYAVEEYALRRSATARPGADDARCRTHGVQLVRRAVSLFVPGIYGISRRLEPLRSPHARPRLSARFNPFGLILTKLAGHGDLRDIGSGNIGATNVLRTGNKKLAALTLLLDLLKGTAAVLIGARFGLLPRSLAARRLPWTSLPGLARLSRRQGRCHLYRHSARTVLAGGDRLLRDLAGGPRSTVTRRSRRSRRVPQSP